MGNNISDFRIGIQMYTGLVQGNYIHDPGYIAGDHTDGIMAVGTTAPMTIYDNTVFDDLGQTSLAFGYEPSLQDSFLDGTGLLLRRVADGRAVWLLLRLRFVRPAGGGGSWHREARVICRILSARAGPGVPASRRGGAGPGWRVHGQAAGGAFGCPGDAATGSGSRCSRAAAGTACPLLRVLTFLMVNRG